MVLLYFMLFVSFIHVLKADCIVASETTASGTFYEAQAKHCPGDLIFEDNFDSFNLKKWQHEITLAGGGNWEFQYYNNNRSNSYVDSDFLHIKPTYLSDDVGEDFLYSGTLECYGGSPADQCTNPSFSGCSRTGTRTHILNPIKSSRIRTVESFSFKYGSVVVRAKLPSGDWLWPAIWLLPRDNAYGNWPASGEIDIMEGRGNKNLIDRGKINVGTQQIGSTLHWGPYSNANKFIKTHWVKNNNSGFDSDFHIYKLVWTSAGITFYVDNEQIGSIAAPKGGFWKYGGFEGSNLNNPWKGTSIMAPFDQEFYLIINLAVGGVTYFSDDFTNAGGKPWSNTSPHAATDFWHGKRQWETTWNLGTNNSHLIVDYVKVFAV